MTTQQCKWCHALMDGEERADRCGGAYACTQRDAYEEGVEAGEAKVAAERDAAVSRSINLRGEVEQERAERVPVADFILSVLDVIDKEKNNYAEGSLVWRTLEAVYEAAQRLPGWDGTEGGFRSGLETTHFVLRDRAEADLTAEREKVRVLLDALAEFEHWTGNSDDDDAQLTECRHLVETLGRKP